MTGSNGGKTTLARGLLSAIRRWQPFFFLASDAAELTAAAEDARLGNCEKNIKFYDLALQCARKNGVRAY